MPVINDDHYGKFTAIETKLYEYPIIGFDTEDDSKGTPVLFAFYGDFPEKKFVTKHAEEALEFIYNVEDPSIFIAHNLEYDIANLCKADNYLMVEKMLYASALLRVDLAGTKHYFLNSHSYFKGTLKNMAGFVGMEKLDGDPFSHEYILKDAEIPYRFIKKFQHKLVNEVGVNLGVSIGKMAMDTYRKDHMISKKQITYNSPNCLKAYYGGRVEIFKKGMSKKIAVSDINSSYPNAMKNEEYPDTSQIEPSSIETHEFGIGKFTVFVSDDIFIPVLPYKSPEGRLFFPKGTFTGWWPYNEMRYAVECGTKIVKEHEGEGTNRGCRPFESFIDTYYEKRQETKQIVSGFKLKKKKSPNLEKPLRVVEATFDDLFYKFWLNNLYGKWCQHKDGSEMTRDRWSYFKLEKARENENFKERKVGPFYSYTVPKTELPTTANFMWGIYITGYARINLHKGMQGAHVAGHELLYCDTDSVMYIPKNKNIPFKISNELGDWDDEYFDMGLFLQAKGYLLCSKEGNEYVIKKVACKGVPTAYAYDFIIEGLAKFMKPLRMKEALIRVNAKVNEGKDEFLKDIGENIWYDVEKEMKSIYIKRIGNSVTHPVDVKDIQNIEENSAMTEPVNVKKELAVDNVTIKKPVRTNNFENTIIPENYFNGVSDNNTEAKELVSQELHMLRAEQCLDLKVNEIWFSGHIMYSRKNSKGKKQYVLFITKYKGKTLRENFWGEISARFLKKYGLPENLVGNYLELSINSLYLGKRAVDLSVDISKSNIEGQLDLIEVDDNDDEPSAEQIKTLMAFDWNKLR